MPLIWTGPVEQEKPQNSEEQLEKYEKRGERVLIKDGYSLRMDDE